VHDPATYDGDQRWPCMMARLVPVGEHRVPVCGYDNHVGLEDEHAVSAIGVCSGGGELSEAVARLGR
jgi:hypothetical protein